MEEHHSPCRNNMVVQMVVAVVVVIPPILQKDEDVILVICDHSPMDINNNRISNVICIIIITKNLKRQQTALDVILHNRYGGQYQGEYPVGWSGGTHHTYCNPSNNQPSSPSSQQMPYSPSSPGCHHRREQQPQ